MTKLVALIVIFFVCGASAQQSPPTTVTYEDFSSFIPSTYPFFDPGLGVYTSNAYIAVPESIYNNPNKPCVYFCGWGNVAFFGAFGSRHWLFRDPYNVPTGVTEISFRVGNPSASSINGYQPPLQIVARFGPLPFVNRVFVVESGRAEAFVQFKAPPDKFLYEIQLTPNNTQFAIDNLEVRKISNEPTNLKVIAIDIPEAVSAANNQLAIRPNVPIAINVLVSGEYLSPDSTTPVEVTLAIGSVQLTQTIQIGQLVTGSGIVSFVHTFSLDELGSMHIQASLHSADDSDPSDNSLEREIYVLCGIEDKGVSARFYSQVNPAWASEAYGPNGLTSKGETIRAYGCYLSNVAMNMYTYDIKKDDFGSELNPSSLNSASKSAFAYGAYSMMDDQGLIIGQGMVDYARGVFAKDCSGGSEVTSSCKLRANSQISFVPTRSYNRSYVVERICRNGNPINLELKIPATSRRKEHSHFVMATGITVDAAGELTYLVNDPGSAAGANRILTEIFPTNSNPIIGMRPYIKAGDPAMMLVTASEGVEYVMTDSVGRRQGRNPISQISYSEIPGAEYYKEFVPNEDPESDAPDLPTSTMLQHSVNVSDGLYQFEFFPTKAGPYSVAVHGYDRDGNQSFALPKAGIATGYERILMSFAQYEAPLKEGTVILNKLLIVQPNGGGGDKIHLEAVLRSSNANFQISLNKYFVISIGSYTKSVLLSDFKKVEGPSGTNFVFEQAGPNGYKVILDRLGAVNFKSRENIQFDMSNPVGILLQIGDTKGADKINFQCRGSVCTSKSR